MSCVFICSVGCEIPGVHCVLWFEIGLGVCGVHLASMHVLMALCVSFYFGVG